MFITRRGLGFVVAGAPLGAVAQTALPEDEALREPAPSQAAPEAPAPPTPAPERAAPEAPRVDPRLTQRSTGRAGAPVVVQEFFSLTCGHCAAFHNTTWPRVKRELVETSHIQFIWRDFPLDGVALAAACVARALPAERYEAFISTLFQTQERWAFAQGRQIEELARIASLAGMNRASFDATLADEGLRRGVLELRLAAEREFQIRATPSFTFNGTLQSGNIAFDQFLRLTEAARKA